ncbi:MAG: cohesin domain-containing protein [Candidatus Paceibacterota bacterium]|jgi:hypothetical protein
MKKLLWCVFAGMFLLSCGGGGGSDSGGGGSASTTPIPVVKADPITVIPSAVTANTDGQFTIRMSVNGVQGVNTVRSLINFDPSLITYIGATQGTFFPSSCTVSLVSSVSPNSGEEGKIIFGITTLGTCADVPSSGTAVRFTFKVIGSGQTTSISFSSSSYFKDWLENTVVLPPVQVAIK